MKDECFTPDWVQDAIFYQIFPDRFASSSKVEKPDNFEPWDTPPTHYGFKGGDLLGICERLDYLQDLGVNALYLNPIFQSACNHRYHTHDYYQVDPLLGGDAALEALLKEAHGRGIRVILDGVFNHTGRGFFQFNHILETGKQSPYLDWFRVKGFPLHAYEGKPNYDCWWNIPALPELNTKNPRVRAFIYGVARHWLEKGIDGWRLDVPSCIDDDSFWREFRQVCRKANPECYLVGEIAEDATRWLKGDQFDGVMNYLLAYPCWGFFGGSSLKREELGNWANYAGKYLKLDALRFAQAMKSMMKNYPRCAVYSQYNLLDSHDSARFLTVLGGDKALYKLAVFFLFTLPGAPSVYYGDEIGMEGSQDPDCRRSFPWDQRKWDRDLLEFFRMCIRLRKDHPALRRGTFEMIYSVGERLVYQRELDGECLVGVINRSDSAWQVEVPLGKGWAEGTVLENLLGKGAARVEGGKLSWLSLPPRGMALLKVRLS